MGGRPAGGAPAPPPVSPDGDRAGVRGRACARRGRAGAARSAPAARARECVIAALFVFAAVLLTVPAVVRAGRRARRDADGDAPARLLAFAVTGLPETHRDWGRAMSAELETVCGRGPRWRFSLGCARAAGVIRVRVTLTSRERGGAGLRAVIGVGVSAAVALGGYGLVRYPGLRSGDARDRRGRVRGAPARLRRGHAGALARDGLASDRRTAPRPGRRRGDRRRMAGRPLADRDLEAMGPRPADRSRCSAPDVSPRWRRATASTSPPEPAPRCGAGSWAACWSSPSG